MEVNTNIEIGTKFGKGKKNVFGVKLYDFFKKHNDKIELVIINDTNELVVKLNENYTFENDVRIKKFIECRVLEQLELFFENLKYIPPVEKIDESLRTQLIEQKFKCNGLVTELGLKIKRCTDVQELLKYANMLNAIEEILESEHVNIIGEKPNNLKAKEQNKEKRKKEFIKKFQEAKDKLEEDYLKDHGFKGHFGLNEILKKAKLNKQTFYNYGLNELFTW